MNEKKEHQVEAFYKNMPIGILGKYSINSGLRFAPELYLSPI